MTYSITSRIAGVSAWAYDFDRNPTNDSTKAYFAFASQTEDYIEPVSQSITKYVNGETVHSIRLLTDYNHFLGTGSYRYNGVNSSYFDFSIGTSDTHLSVLKYNNMSVHDNVILTGSPVVSGYGYHPVTSTSKGITIINQTGIVPTDKGSGYGYIVFKLDDNYTIPKGSIIKVNGDRKNSDGSMVPAPSLDFAVSYDMKAGLYGITYTDQYHSLNCSIDFSTVSTVPVSKKYNITWELMNCSVTPNDTILEKGIHTWTFKADDGYYFEHSGGIYDDNNGEYGNEIAATGNDTATLTYNLTSNFVIRLSATKRNLTTIPITQNLTNATSNVNGIEVDRKINQLIISANNGYQLKDDILIQLFTGSIVAQSCSIAGASGTNVTVPFNTNTQNTITDTITKIVITAVAVQPEKSTGYSHYYAITQTEIHQFSKERIWDTTKDTYDVSKYIDNLIELPFKYDTSELPTSTISVGRIDTVTTSHEIKERFYSLDLGKIIVPSKYKNGYDYQVRSCNLYLPFAPVVPIDITNAMEQVIHIVYKIDISTGNTTITLDNNGVAFNTLNINIAADIPFLNTLKNTVIKDGQHQIYNDINNPYLIITRNQPLLDNDYYPTREQSRISSYHGRLTAKLLDNTGITDNADMKELENILSNGVIYL